MQKRNKLAFFLKQLAVFPLARFLFSTYGMGLRKIKTAGEDSIFPRLLC